MVEITVTGSQGTVKSYDVSVDSIILFVERGFNVSYQAFSIRVNGVSSIGETPSTTFLFSSVTIQQLKDFGLNVEIISSGFLSLTGKSATEINNIFNVTEQEVKSIFGIDINGETPPPTPPPIPPPTPEQEVTQDMVLQNNGVWTIDQDRIMGEILYIATNKFNPFFYDKVITSLVQFKDKNGTIISIKLNNLQFFETQRDERLMFDERIGFDNEIVSVSSFVWVNETTDNRAFSKSMLFTVKRIDPPKVPPPTSPIKGNTLKFLPYALISALFLNSARR